MHAGRGVTGPDLALIKDSGRKINMSVPIMRRPPVTIGTPKSALFRELSVSKITTPVASHLAVTFGLAPGEF